MADLPDGLRGHYLDGHWQTDDSATLEVVDPSTEEVVGHTPEGSPGAVDAAVRAAATAFVDWSETSPSDRRVVLHAIADEMLLRRNELAATITAEVGVPVRSSGPVQVDLAIEIFRYYADYVMDHPFVETLGWSQVYQVPAGVVGAITPWNYPLYQIASKVAPALAAGCTVVLKPSEVAPLNTVLLAEAISSADVPAGVVNIVFGTGIGAGEAIVAHPSVNLVSFTGSTRAGRRVSALAAENVKPVALELGGKSAGIVAAGAPLERAVRDTLAKCYANSGQNCGALSRLLVPRAMLGESAEVAASIAEEYPIGDPLDTETRLGPLVNRTQFDRVAALIAGGVNDGARLVRGAHPTSAMPRGFFVEPHVFSDVEPDMDIAQQEIFGPVLSIIGYDSPDDAVAIANGTPYGLCGSVWADDPDEALRLARRVRAGQVDVNGADYNPLAPFGGFGESGHGRELGPYGIREYLVPQAVQVQA